MTLLSIIIPVYNRVTLIKLTLESIRNQSNCDFECMIVDDNSTDGTWEFLEEFCSSDNRFKAIQKPPHIKKGPSSSRNFGLRQTRGEYVHFFDSDDLVPPDFYLKCFEKIGKNNFDFFSVRIRWFSEEDPEGLLSPKFSHDEFIDRAITRKHDIWTQNVIWRRDLLDRCPNFNESITMSEDILFAVEAMKTADHFSFCNDLYVSVRRHSQSLTFQNNLERNIARQDSVFNAYLQIFNLISKQTTHTTEAQKYCMTKLYLSLSELYEMRQVNTTNIHRLAVITRLFVKNNEWRLLLKSILFLPIKSIIKQHYKQTKIKKNNLPNTTN